ncbi:hypothetical protein L7F22_060166 [Adiantum nelumboides]|nr:hypothetical protein [Adiantum nelumboides]
MIQPASHPTAGSKKCSVRLALMHRRISGRGWSIKPSMTCTRPNSVGLESAAWKLMKQRRHHYSSSTMGTTFELDPQTLKALNELNATTHIDVDTYATLLQACTSSKNLLHGLHVHQHIMIHGHGGHMLLGFLILEMYSKCGAVEDAASWFSKMPHRTICAWNHMIALFSRSDRTLKALHLFVQMLQEGMLADKITYISIITVCSSLSLLEEGKRMNARVVGCGCESQVVVATALISLYGKCDDSRRAQCLFDAMPRRDAVTWSALISGYKQNRHGKEALQLFDQMLMEGVFPSRATFACTLSVCTSQVYICQGKRMHLYVIHTNLESEFVISNALVRMYSQCGSLKNAQKLYKILSARNVVASNAMLAAYSQHGCLRDALKLLVDMQHEGIIVDMISYIHMLDVCGKQAALAEGKQMHDCIKRSGYGERIIIGNALVSMYGRCQSLEDAKQAFDEMPERDVVSWNAIISAFVDNGVCKEALRFFDLMQQGGFIPNTVTFICVLDAISSQADLLHARWFQMRLQLSEFCSDVIVATALINMYGKTGSLTNARTSFDNLREPNVVSWTAMISASSFNGHDKEALQIYEQMLQQGVVPDVVTYLNTIVACTSLAALNEGKRVHVYVQHCGSELEIAVVNGLVNMYGKCGDLFAACSLFEETYSYNVASWNVMMSLHAQHGLGDEALLLLQQMQKGGIAPDRITYITYLSACSRAGLLEEAVCCLWILNGDTLAVSAAVEHFDCIVDLLARAGQSCEAETVIELLPFHPSPLSWMTLLTVCRNLLDVERGECSAKHVIEVDSKDHVPYVMLANIYCAVGREEDAEHVLSLIDDKEQLFSEGGTSDKNLLEEEPMGGFELCYGYP